jgi:hypothetical protein
MAAEVRADAGIPAVRGRRPARPAIWPWLLMPLVVLLVFAALLRIHHRPGTPWASLWSQPSAESAPPAH